jgi:hypothetical protein
MWCKPSKSETVASFPFNRRSARPPGPHVLWQHGLRRLTPASLPGHEPEIPISGTGGPPEVLVRTGLIPDKYETGDGVD